VGPGEFHRGGQDLPVAVEPRPATFKVRVGELGSVTARLYRARRDRIGATLILGHGAGADQSSAFIVEFASALAARGIDLITFNFLYKERQRGFPDRNEVLEACYHSVVPAAIARKSLHGNSLFIGGKSMGGRIASQIAAAGVEGLAGMVFLGYPLHPPGKPEKLRTAHLPSVNVPMLFVQGEHDAFGTPAELQAILATLPAAVELYAIAGADHSLVVPKRWPTSQSAILSAVQDRIVEWISRKLSQRAK
jgi:predicted alpha/beta-hydrolase family hydrolase